jgi:hypothetical protein
MGADCGGRGRLRFAQGRRPANESLDISTKTVVVLPASSKMLLHRVSFAWLGDAEQVLPVLGRRYVAVNRISWIQGRPGYPSNPQLPFDRSGEKRSDGRFIECDGRPIMTSLSPYFGRLVKQAIVKVTPPRYAR